MKKKIYFNVTFLSIGVTILVSIFMMMTFFKFHERNQMKSLKNTGNLISSIILSSNINEYTTLKNYRDTNIRITILDMEGNIVFDNMADIKGIENHIDRPEFQDSIKTGQGEAVRYSSTMGYDTYYYALKMSNELVLRVSQQTENFFSFLSTILPIVFLIILIISIFSFYISSLLSGHILKPIGILTQSLEKNLEDDSFKELYIYDELSPFIRALKKQNYIIIERNRDLEEKANLLDTIISSMDEGIILIDTNKTIISLNNSGVLLFNGNTNIKYPNNDFIKLCRNIELNKVLDISIQEESSNEISFDYGNKHLNIYISPVLRESKLTGLLLLVVDSTEKHKLDLMRREFSANVSHELKTPLTSINGYAEMIANNMVNHDDITKFASIIKKEGVRLLNLIDDIIKLSKIEEESNKNTFEQIDLFYTGKEVASRLEFLALKKDISIELIGNTSYIMGNKGMIQDLIYNLLDNSIKYTNKGGHIKLNIYGDKQYTYIEVIDTGIGISLEEQDRIFERFYTIDKSRSSKTQSTGLGLSIVKHIVEYHNGKIELKSEIEKGTSIKIKFFSI